MDFILFFLNFSSGRINYSKSQTVELNALRKSVDLPREKHGIWKGKENIKKKKKRVQMINK